jgi:hypothetical protein
MEQCEHRESRFLEIYPLTFRCSQSTRILMARLAARDVNTILQFLEDGIRLIPKTNRAQKTAARSKIRRQFSWLSQLSAPSAGMVLNELEQKLPDLFPLYPMGVRERLKEIVKERLKE